MKTELSLRGKRVHVKTHYAPVLVERFRAIPGRLWHAEDKTWSFPLVRDVLCMVCDVLGLLPLFLPAELRAVMGPSPQSMLRRIESDGVSVDNWHFRTQPYAHQRRNLETLLNYRRWLLADEMGTGKSFVIACRLTSCFGPALILCPKSVMPGWLDQLYRHAGIVGYLDKDVKLHETYSPLIVNYEKIRDCTDLNSLHFRTVVFDEIHRLKSFTSKTAKVCRFLSERAEWVYGLSGTPAPNGLEDWFGVLSALDPHLLPVKTKGDFESRYCLMGTLPDSNIRVVRGYRNVEELHGYINAVTSRVTKAECLDLPDKVISPRYVSLHGEQARVYYGIRKEAVATIRSLRAEGKLTVKNALTEGLRLAQITGGFVPDDTGAMHALPEKAKAEALWEILEDLEGKQVVIWCAFVAEVHWIAEQLRTMLPPRTVSVLTGSVLSAQERQEQIERFTTGQAQYFIGTAATGGVGINGLEVCDTEVYYSRTWSLTDWLQSQDRLHRIGQKNKVTIIPIIATNTIDERIDLALERKQDLQEMMLTRPELIF